ncbi:hypothetical protein MetexDRAFT_6153, partial [Methylorubrum extorquens DSM 13060]
AATAAAAVTTTTAAEAVAAGATAAAEAVTTARGQFIGPTRLGTTLVEAALLRPPEITTTSH